MLDPTSAEEGEKATAKLQSPSAIGSDLKDDVNNDGMALATASPAAGELDNVSTQSVASTETHGSGSDSESDGPTQAPQSPSLGDGEPDNMSSEGPSSSEATDSSSEDEPDKRQAILDEKEAALKPLRKRAPDEDFGTDFKKPRYAKGWKPSNAVPSHLNDAEKSEWNTSRGSETSHLQSLETSKS